MQHNAGRSADQRRRFADLDISNFNESVPRNDPAGYTAARRHQSRSDNDCNADAEYFGVRREHDDESCRTRDDGASQCHGRRGNARRIAAGLLTRAG
jgi:hypothetical protein